MKKLNKLQLVSFILVISVILTSASLILKNNSTISKNTTNTGFSSHMHDMNNIDDIVKYSDNVIVGTIMNKMDFDQSLAKYTVSIDKSMKGDLTSTDIDVYESKDTLQIGKQYILFLGCSDSALYPREKYTSMDKDCIIEIDNDKLISKNKFKEKDHNLESIIKTIEKSSGIKFNNKKNYNVKDEFVKSDDIIAASEYIVQILATESMVFNQFVADIKVDIIQQYKGDIGNVNKILLPSNIESGKEYLLYLNRTDGGSLVLASRKGSVICKDNLDEWNKAISALEANK